MNHSRKEGAVTVFLSLIIVLILAIACSTLEVTRIQIAKAQVERAMNTAMTSVLAEYDKELLDSYGLMALDTTYGTEALDTAQMKDNLKGYLQHALEPQDNLRRSNLFYQLLFEQNNQYIDLFRYEVKEVEIHNMTSLIAEQGEIFKNQIIEYMKYRGPYLLIEGFLEKLELISKAAATADIIEEKAVIEEKAAKAGAGYLELMTLIDGITYRRGQVQINGQGQPIITTPFIKQLNVAPQQSGTLVNHPQVNQAMAEKIYDAYSDMEQIPKDLDGLYTARVQYYELEPKIEALQEKIDVEKDDLRSLKRKEDDIEEDIDEAKEKDQPTGDLKDKLSGVRDDIDEVEEKIDELEEEKETFEDRQQEMEEKGDYHYTQYQMALERLQTVLIGVHSNHIAALDLIEEMSREMQALGQTIDAYQAQLDANQEAMIQETHQALQQDITNLKIQLGLEEASRLNLNPFGNIQAIKETLEKNKQRLDVNEINHLEQVYNRLFYIALDAEAKTEAENGVSGKLLKETTNELKIYFDKIKEYEIRGLDFDYSDFGLGSQKDAIIDPRSNQAFQNTEGMEEEVVPPAFEALGETFKEGLPSEVWAENKLQETSDLGTPNFENRNFAIEAMDFLKDLGTNLVKGLDEFSKELLVNEYIMGNFRSATDHLDDADGAMISQGTVEDHHLAYEVEYILEGQLDEEANFSAVKNKIILTRFALNLIHILADPIKRQETFSLAVALIGWSPIAFLVYIAQFLIMCAWSFGESYIDLKYLLEGKKVAFLKTKGDWVLSLTGISQFAVDKLTEEVNEQINQVAQYTVDKTNEIVDNFSQEVETGVKEYANEQISGLIDEAYRMGNDAVDAIDQEVDNALDEWLVAASEGIDLPAIEVSIVYNGAETDLMDLLAQEVNQRKDELVDETINGLIQVKEEIKNQLKAEINQAKQLVRDKVEAAITSSVQEVSDEIKGEIAAGGEQVADVAKDKVNEISQSLKDKLDTKVGSSVSGQVQSPQTQKSLDAKSAFAFSYEDYLRVFLLLFVDNTEKLYRTMDCIQMNEQVHRENFVLNNQLFEYEATVTVEMAPIFFNLPFMPEGAKDFGKKNYSLQVGLAQSY